MSKKVGSDYDVVIMGVFPLEEVGSAARLVRNNEHIGKVGGLCMAPERGLGVTDPALRAKIGEDRMSPLLEKKAA